MLITKNIPKSIGMLQYVKQYLPMITIQRMHTSPIEPYFRYCCPVWDCVGTTTLQELQRLQNRAARVATNSCFDAPSERLKQELGWPTIERLIELVKAVHKALHNKTPLYMKELFLKLSDTQSKELRNLSIDLYLPRLRASMCQKSFGYRGVRFWNKPVDEAKGAKTYLTFKRMLWKRIKH